MKELTYEQLEKMHKAIDYKKAGLIGSKKIIYHIIEGSEVIVKKNPYIIEVDGMRIEIL